ncbi:MAG TPA: hypothetical protein VLD37_04295, partial [Candidatus Bilamarchaeum sp.]|nr:hypothetical protein [Candidatus Bilamarchaeum sp.]
MRLAIVFFSLLLLILQNALVITATEPCIACSTFANASSANILYGVDQFNKTLTVNLFYEDFASSPSRLPINNTVIIVEMTNSTGLKEIYK